MFVFFLSVVWTEMFGNSSCTELHRVVGVQPLLFIEALQTSCCTRAATGLDPYTQILAVASETPAALPGVQLA